jgi:hypothetical protein
MRRLFLILPLLLVIASCNQPYRGSRGPSDWIYISPTGNDETGNGTSGAPYLTLAKAVTEATAGDTIYVTAGTYNIATQIDLPAGISIYGAGATSILLATDTLEPMLSLLSVAEGTDGAQTISNLYLDGDLKAVQALLSRGRSNIKFHDVTVKDFLGDSTNVVIFNGRVTGSSEPTTYATGIEVHDCTFINNGKDFLYDASTYFAYAALEIIGTQGALIYDNYFDNVTGGRYGYGIKCISGYIRGAKIHDNEFHLNFRDETSMSSYSFAVELWNGTGGVEIYNNYCNGGGIDLAGRGWDDKYSYGYAAKVYGNTVVMNTQPVYTAESALLFESGCDGGVYFYGNYVKNFTIGFSLSLRQDADTRILNVDGLYIYYNIFDNLGRNNSTAPGYGITDNLVNSTANPFTPTVNDFLVANNVIYHPILTAYGLYMAATTGGNPVTWTNTTIANNIFYKMYWSCQFKDQTIDTITVSNNFFTDAEDPLMFNNCTVTNADTTAGADTDPLFKSSGNFRLQSTSPAINAGINVSLTSDFAGHRVPQQDTVDIGAYEYGDYLFRTPSGNLLRNANGKLMITH